MVEGYGPVPSSIMILGEAPGRDELAQGRPFVGRSGTLLDRLLAEAGLSRADIYCANTCSCVDMAREDKRPLPGELDACRPRLDSEIFVVSPRVIVCVGNTAIQRYYPGYRIGEVYNQPRAVSSSLIAVPTYHPAAVLRGNAQVRSVIVDALKLAKQLAA